MAIRIAWERATRTKPLNIDAVGTQEGLRRCLRLRDIVGFGLGCTVGGGIFVATGVAVSEAGPGVILSFLLAAVGCACSGLCYAEMSSLAPAAGSSYSFSYNAVGELAAFVVGIMNILGNVLSSAAVARGWASYLNLLLIEVGVQPPKGFDMFKLGPFTASPVAALLMVLLGMVNCFGTRTTATANSVVTAISIAMLAFFVVGSMPSVEVARWKPFLPNGVGGVFRGAGTVFFAYLGFDVLACLGEEAEDPTIVARGIIWTLVVSTLLYCATAMTFTGLVTVGEVNINAPLASAARLRGLDALALCISVGAVGNTMTTVIGGILGAPRVCYVMSQDGLLPQAFAKVNRHGTPVCALMVTIVPTAICAGLVEFGELAEIVSAGALCSFSLVCASVTVIRHALASEGSQALTSEVVESSNGAHNGSSPELHVSPSLAEVEESSNGARHGGSLPQKPAPTVVGQRSHVTGNSKSSRSSERAKLNSEGESVCKIKASDTNGELDDAESGEALRDIGQVSFDEIQPEGDCKQPLQTMTRSSLGRYLGGFAIFCLGTGLALRLPAARSISGVPLRLIFSLISVSGALLAAARVIVCFRRMGSTKLDNHDKGFRLPLMPLVPLTGIMMNMMLLSDLPVEALWRTLVVVLLCFVLYFGYAAPRSHRNDPETVAFNRSHS